MGKMHKNYKWEVLALLWMAYLLNQADRQVFNTVLPAISHGAAYYRQNKQKFESLHHTIVD